MNDQTTVFHVITSTGMGGAEMMLEKFLTRHESMKNSLVISMVPLGIIGEQLVDRGVMVQTLDMSTPLTAVTGFLHYAKLMRQYRPRKIVAWMYHANLLASLYSIIFRGPRVIWNIRCGVSQYRSGGLSKRVLLCLSRLLSGHPDKIVFNSHRSLEEHCEYGLRRRNCVVIYNGFARTEVGLPDSRAQRQRLGIRIDVFLIGSFGRNAAVKRMGDLLKVCAALRAKGCLAEVLFIGRNFDSAPFQNEIKASGVDAFVHVISEVSSLSPYYPLIDMFCLCSDSEGFPNVIGEAVYASVPVICTDVSDMKRGFLEPWQVSPVADIASLAASALRIYRMDSLERQQLINAQLTAFHDKTELSSVVTNLGRAFFADGRDVSGTAEV